MKELKAAYHHIDCHRETAQCQVQDATPSLWLQCSDLFLCSALLFFALLDMLQTLCTAAACE